MAFFAIPDRGDHALQEDLNAFLRSHRVLTMQQSSPVANTLHGAAVHREFMGQGDCVR